jgi:hypothetical protein
MSTGARNTLLLLICSLGLVFGGAKLTDWFLAIVPASWKYALPGQVPPLYRNLEDGFEHLGVVIVVALLVRATLETASQHEFISLVNQQVKDQIAASTKEVAHNSIRPLEEDIRKLTKGLTYRIANLFDEPLSKILEDSVLNPTFIRPDYTLHIKLKPLPPPASPDLFEVYLGISYEVQNVAMEAVEYPIEFWIDDLIESPSRCRFTRVAFGDDKTRLRSFDIRDLEDGKEIVRQNGVLSLQLKTGKIQPGSTRYVDIQAIQPMRAQDHFVWNMAGLTQKLNIVVELMDHLNFDNLNVFPREMHHCGHEVFQRTAERTANNTLKMRIEQVLLPYQGVEIRWSPHVASAAANQAEA